MPNPTRFILLFFTLLFVQVFLLRQISIGFGGKDYIFLYITPLFVALLPLLTPRPLVVLLGFLLGLAVDFFYETLGLHAAAGAFIGYARWLVLNLLEPQDGYKAKSSNQGRALTRNWWLSYLFFMIAGYCLFYFSVEAFSHVYWLDVLLKTLFTVPVTWLFCSALVLFFQPRL